MFENLDLGTIITIVIAVVGTFASGFWLKAKGKLSKVIKLGNEAFDVVEAFEESLKDDKVSKEEVANIKLQVKEAREAWKDLVSKD